MALLALPGYAYGPWRPADKCVHNRTDRSRVCLLAGFFKVPVYLYCSLLTRCTACGRDAETIQNAKQTESNDTGAYANSVVSLQDHCSYSAPSKLRMKSKKDFSYYCKRMIWSEMLSRLHHDVKSSVLNFPWRFVWSGRNCLGEGNFRTES